MQELMSKLVEKAFQRIAAQRHSTGYQLKHKRLTPDIVISRDPGSGGHLVAEMVAAKLKWKFLDKDLMNGLAHELNIPEKEFADVDENTRGWFVDSVQSLLNPHYVNDLHYLSHLKKIILHVAQDDDVVILGRGANLIIPPDQCLRVRITASFSQRVANTVKHESKTREAAAEWVRKVESKRVHFVQQYFGVNPYNPWHYDIVINTDNITLEQARDLTINAFFTKFPAMQKKYGKLLAK
jgi:cytidylate kinase